MSGLHDKDSVVVTEHNVALYMKIRLNMLITNWSKGVVVSAVGDLV